MKYLKSRFGNKQIGYMHWQREKKKRMETSVLETSLRRTVEMIYLFITFAPNVWISKEATCYVMKKRMETGKYYKKYAKKK